MKRVITVSIIFIICFVIKGFGGTTATALDIAGNAYEKNMGYSSAALENSLGGVTYNPAVIADLTSISGSLTYFDYIDDFNMFYGNISYPAFKKLNILGRFGYFYMPSINDIETGEELGYKELFIGAGTGYKFLNNRLSAGAVANFYTATIAADIASTFFLNCGVNYSFLLPTVIIHKFIIGLSILNLGPDITFNSEPSSLPLNINFGVQYIFDHNYKLFAGLRKYTAYDNFLYNIGGEIIIYRILSFRAAMIEDVNSLIKYNLGLGFDLNYTDYHFMLDYAFLPLETVDSAYLITLSFRFPFESEKEDKTGKNWKNMWTSE
ncbi:MAG: hypothetical protein KKH98_02420 [Spirochaetes bacterium]|nr:hypothetical protein [Spirochaetota bacterium]